MYKVTLTHFYPKYRKGDLEEDTEILQVETFKTKKEAKSWVLWQVNGRRYTESWKTGNSPSRVWWFTDNTWINENSGEKRQECYTYLITKAK